MAIFPDFLFGEGFFQCHDNAGEPAARGKTSAGKKGYEMSLFFAAFGGLILAELIKGLSANGTPPVLQRFSWQIHLAYFMWSHIQKFRILFLVALVGIYIQTDMQLSAGVIGGISLCGALWGGIYWLFNKFWVGKYKFLPITQKIFTNAQDNQLDLTLPVIGVEMNGEAKAYPANLLFYHHQLSDMVGGHPIVATYCGMCRSGRVYDANWPEGTPEFALVGAVSFNAILRDNLTNSWWRQETGEAVKGAKKGQQLDDIYFEQMSLENWIARHPDTLILQYDPAFIGKYNFLAKLLSYEASFPRWHLQKTPPLIIGVDLDGHEKAYDLIELQNRLVVNDMVGPHPVVAMSDAAKSSAFMYDRQLDGQILTFDIQDGVITDQETNSEWDHLGRCHKGALKGKELQPHQSYQQFIRAWITFHPNTEFFDFSTMK